MFVCQIEVPMGTTDWHKKQGSGVLSFLREAFMLQCMGAHFFGPILGSKSGRTKFLKGKFALNESSL